MILPREGTELGLFRVLTPDGARRNPAAGADRRPPLHRKVALIYGLVLLAHSWLRWIVLALGLALLGVALSSSSRESLPESTGIERLRRAFLGALDLQLLLGIALYALLSPLSRAGLSDLRGAMADSVVRFYTVEHIVGMVVAISVAHVGSRFASRHDGSRRYRAVAFTQALWLLITLASIPWPGLPYGRPLLRAP